MPVKTERWLLALVLLACVADGACLEKPTPTPGETHSGRGPYNVALTPEGTLNSYLLSRMWGYAGEHLWRETYWGFQKMPAVLPAKPTSWGAVFGADGDPPAWAWRRLRLSSYWDPTNKLWDFCLDKTASGYELVGAWPAADSTKDACKESPAWSRFRPDRMPSSQERGADADRMRPRADDVRTSLLASQRGFRERSRALFGVESAFRKSCADACSPNATTRDCDLCICLGENVGAPACDHLAGR
jgi:hypothetical protein